MVQQLSTLRMLKNKNVNIGVGRCLVINGQPIVNVVYEQPLGNGHVVSELKVH